MNFHEYFGKYKEIQDKFLKFIESQENSDENFNNLIKIVNNSKIQEDKHDFKLFLRLISNVSTNHHRDSDFFNKISKLLIHFKAEIQKFYSNLELYLIFKENKRDILILLDEKMLIMNEEICKNKYDDYWQQFNDYFSPEIKLMKNNNETKDEVDEHFEEKRHIGENDDYLCELIRKDSINEFIDYVNKSSINLSEKFFDKSMFETNSFLFTYHITIAEYAAFFGSVKIFKYLISNDVSIFPLTLQYAVHSRSSEIIHLIEETELVNDKLYTGPQDENSVNIMCAFEAIKCHHNDLANYFLNKIEIQDALILNASVQCCNFEFIDDNLISKSFFPMFLNFDYFNIVKHFITNDDIDINGFIMRITFLIS